MTRGAVLASSVVAAACAGTLAIAVLWPREVRPRGDRDRADRGDDDRERKRVRPSIHRATPAELAVRNRVAQAEAVKLRARAEQRRNEPSALTSVPATTWVPLGPTDAFREENGVDIDSVDAGRPNNIVADPRDPDIVYVAVSGGGVWKTFDFLSPAGPTWAALTDTQPNLAVGSLTLDPDHPDTLYLGTGDPFDFSGNTVQTTTDGGGTWSTPVVLAGTYPPPSGQVAEVGDIRSIAVHGGQVIAGTNAGLFASSDGGASFALIDLPNPGRVLIESIWSVVHIGGGQWVASGVTACDDDRGPAPIIYAEDPGASCPAGNDAEIWRSNDGATWTRVTTPRATGVGRVTLAAGPITDPAATAIYGFVGAVDGLRTVGIWRSLDGGRTWADATGTLANPTMAIAGGGQDCGSLDLGHDQSWYNQAIVVDPTNPDHVLIGGNACGARTLNGTAASPRWELVSHWLPNYVNAGTTANGKLPYVHADWHTATVSIAGGHLRSFAGTDGGIFSATDLFDAATPAEQVSWAHSNRGLATHLLYSVASGDPATGNPFVLFAGAQDNGTRFRTAPASPTVFNMPIGGDGIGATVHVATSGTTYWASVQYARLFCRPTPTDDCTRGGGWQYDQPLLGNPVEDSAEELREDRRYALDPTADDEEPFMIHYANVETDTVGQSVLTHSVGQVFVSAEGPGGNLRWRPISQDLTPSGNGFSSVTASRTIPGLYGASATDPGAPFFVSTTGNTAATWTASQPVRPTGAARLYGASSMDFPPVLPPGTAPGQVYLGAFVGAMEDGSPPPDARGHLWRTMDFGQTWTSIVGADPAHQLPNVAIHVVRYDPVTPTTIYAGTDLGVYLSIDDGASWDRMGDGFPLVPARDLYVAKNQEFIRVATFGRGLWEIYPSAAANHGVAGNGDYDRNLRLDWVDLAAMSSRLGVTPATTTAPLYSWLLDLTGANSDPPVQAIDGADLDGLLAKFGGHP